MAIRFLSSVTVWLLLSGCGDGMTAAGLLPSAGDAPLEASPSAEAPTAADPSLPASAGTQEPDPSQSDPAPSEPDASESDPPEPAPEPEPAAQPSADPAEPAPAEDPADPAPPCNPDEVGDCNGSCAPVVWIGDGSCDDGGYSWRGEDIVFNCAEHGEDGGDCGSGPATGCLPDEVEDCDGSCAPAEWVGDGSCDDGAFSWDGAPVNLDCAALGDDGGDCVSCPAGEIPDCAGTCAPSSWIGDGSCDDGTYGWNGAPVVFDCSTFGSDGGDC